MRYFETREQEFLKRIEKIDIDVNNFIECNTSSTSVKNLATKRWEEVVEQDRDKINTEWHKKIESTKDTFKRDKEFLKKHQQSRLKNNKYSTKSQHDSNYWDKQNDFQELDENSTSISKPSQARTPKEDVQSKNVNSSRQRFQLQRTSPFNLRSNRR